MNSVDRLVEYYNALVEGDWPTLVNCFDLPSKVISLYGVVNFECKEQIQNVYESVLDTWRQNGIAQEFSYKRDTFRVEKIQENINLVQTKLTNYDFDGNYLQDFNCSYIIRKEGDNWLISLATSSNKSNTSFK